jgi:hypothetical protein
LGAKLNWSSFAASAARSNMGPRRCSFGANRVSEVPADRLQDYLRPRLDCQGRDAGASPNTPFSPWARIVCELLEVDQDQPETRRAERIAEAVARLVPDLAPITPVLDAIIPTGLRDNEVTRTLDEEAKRRRLFELVTAIVAASARRSAMAVILEDIHWADTSSVQLAAHVADSLAASRVLIYPPLVAPIPWISTLRTSDTAA